MEISEVGSVGRAKQNKKRLIVCCDGTWNDSISTDSPLTNVSRISRLITDIGDHGIPQVVYYHTGVGSGTSAAGNVVDGMSGRGESVRYHQTFRRNEGPQGWTLLIPSMIRDFCQHPQCLLLYLLQFLK